MRACRLLASKSVLAARVDCFRGDPTGKTGRLFRDEIVKKIEKLSEQPPGSKPKKMRGGLWQGIELPNPEAAVEANQLGSTESTYFSNIKKA